MGTDYAAGSGFDMALVNLDQPTHLLSQKLRHAGIVALDPTARFEALFESGVTLYGKVDRHLNGRGHEELARFILPAVADMLSSPRRPASNAEPAHP